MKRRLLNHAKAADAGFTMLELLVVIIIIAIFAAIAAPSWTRYLANRRAQAVQTELKQVLEEAQTRARTTRSTQTVEIDTTATATVPSVIILNDLLDTSDDRVVAIAEEDLRPGMVNLTAEVANSTDTRVSFDYQGALEEPFVIEIDANLTDRNFCVAALTLIGGLVSGDGDDCTAFKDEIGL